MLENYDILKKKYEMIIPDSRPITLFSMSHLAHHGVDKFENQYKKFLPLIAFDVFTSFRKSSGTKLVLKLLNPKFLKNICEITSVSKPPTIFPLSFGKPHTVNKNSFNNFYMWVFIKFFFAREFSIYDNSLLFDL